MQFLNFFSLLQKHGLSYVFYGTNCSSRKIWTIICILLNFFPFSKKWSIICNFGIYFPSQKTWSFICKFQNFFLIYNNMVYHMQYSKFLSHLQKSGLSYAIYGIS